MFGGRDSEDLGLFLGASRYQMTVPNFDAYHIAFYNDRDYDLFVTGTLAEPPDYRDNYTNLRLKVTNVDTGDRLLPAEGLLLARVPSNQVYHYGDIVRLRGKVIGRIPILGYFKLFIQGYFQEDSQCRTQLEFTHVN